MLFDYDFTVEAHVDGTARDPATIWHHAQDDPYPGGHRFELIFRGAAARDYFSELRGFALSTRTRLDTSVANYWFNMISPTLARRSNIPPIDFVLNTIDTVESSGDTIRITGECSPFVRS